MDELDREIKAVQLQRERLALDRELARERLRKRMSAGPVAVLGALAVILEGARRIFVNWWKAVVLIALLASVVLGTMEWWAHVERERKEGREQLRQDAEHAYVVERCGQPCSSDGTTMDKFNCARQDLDRYDPCSSAAKRRFEEHWPRSR